MGFPKAVARDAVAQLAHKAGWPRKVTADTIRDWSRGKPNLDTAIHELSGSLFITIYEYHLQRDLHPIAAWALLIRNILRKSLLAPATSEDKLWDF